MSNIISRLEYEPESFVVKDKFFIEFKGDSILVRCFGGWFWHLVVSGGQVVAGYHRLSVLQNIRVIIALRGIKKIQTQEEQK
jgi:hypothetical protein